MEGKAADPKTATVQFNGYLEAFQGPLFLDYLASSFSPGETDSILAPINAREHSSRPKTLKEILRENVRIIPSHDRNFLITVVTTHPVPGIAALLANRFARKSVDYADDRENAGVQVAIDPHTVIWHGHSYVPIKVLDRAPVPTAPLKETPPRAR